MSALLSDCERYRYRLDRNVDMFNVRVIAFVGVNPSTADARVDDATVRKWTRFAQLLSARHFVVGNCFGYRATDVRTLGKLQDPVGPENDLHLQTIFSEADLIIPCWGARTKVPETLHYRFDVVKVLMRSAGKPIQCFGLTGSGDPKHVLMLPYSTSLVEFPL